MKEITKEKLKEAMARHPLYSDGKTAKTAMQWKLWAREKGFIYEKTENKTFAIIFDAINFKRVKILKRIN